MFENLREVEVNFEETNRRMTDPAIISNQDEYRKLSKLRNKLEPVIDEYRRYVSFTRRLEEAREIYETGADPEFLELAKQEIEELEPLIEKSIHDLKVLMLPKDPNDEKDIIVEIRAGAGGNEAGLFAGDLFRMYSRYAENMGWKIQLLNKNETGVGGLKEVIFSIVGREPGVYSKLKYESGVHRVQRVPTTEAQGRIHTSTVTVAIMPEAEDVEIEIKEEDLRVDRFCASGHGGQSVNTTQSAIRITHLPSGLVVQCQDEKSQHKNRAAALKVLKARLYDQELRKQQDQIAGERRAQVGTGDRSERIRTYNFPQGRVTDHRIGLTLYKLLYVMEGALDELIDALTACDQTEKLKSLGAGGNGN